MSQITKARSLPLVTPSAPKWLVVRSQVSRYALVLKRKWWILLLSIALGLGVAAIAIAKTPPSYRSSARMMVSGRVNIAEGSSGYTEELMNFFGTQIELMQSGEVQSRAQARVQSLYPDLKPVKVDFNVGQEPKASIFILRITASDGTYAQRFLDACMDEYIRMKRERRSETSGSTLAALTEELSGIEKELRTSEDEMLKFQQEHNLGYIREEGNSAALYLSIRNRELADLTTEYQLLQTLDLDQNIDRQPRRADAVSPGVATTSQDPFLLANGPALDYQHARQQLRITQAQRDQLSQYMRPKHPDIVKLDEEIEQYGRIADGFRQQATEQISNRRQGLKVQIDNLHDVIKEWENKAANLSRSIAENDKLRSKLDRLKAQYDRVFASTRSLDVTRSVDQDSISILEHASTPLSVKPGFGKTIAVGLLGGIFIGCLILFIIDRLDDRLTSVLDVQMHFTDMVLGQVMMEPHVGRLQILQQDDQRHGFAESFRNFRSSLLYMPFEGERPKTILLTSAIPNEGKSTIAANLAVALALAGSKTLLVDGDLRRGGLHRVFELGNEVGFAEVIMGLVEATEAIQPTAVENLSLLPRGRSITQGSEKLLGPITDRFLKEVYAEYDHVILDSSPVLVADDTTSIAPKMDAVICVIRFNHSSARLTRRVIEILKHRQANIIGLVINAVDSTAPEYGYYKYKDYYKIAKSE